MLAGTVQAVVTLLTIAIFYTIDSILIRYYDRQRRASGSGRSWDFTRAAQQEETLLTLTLPGCIEYAWRTPRFLPRIWRSR